MSLLSKLLIAILTPFIIINTLVFYTTSSLSNSYLKEQFYENARIKLLHIENNINTYFKDLKNSTDILLKLIELNKNKKSETKVILETFINRFPEIHAISIVNSNGEEELRVSQFFDDNTNESQSYFYSPLYYKPMLDNKAYLGEAIKKKNYDHKIIGFSLPMKDPDTGENIGVIILKISLQKVFEIMDQNIPKEGSITLSEKDNLLITSSSTSKIKTVGMKNIIDKILKNNNQNGIFHLILNNNIAITTLYKKINVFNKTYFITFSQPDDFTFALLNKLKSKNITIFTIGFISFILFIIWIINLITKPLIKVSKEIIELTYKYENNPKNKLKLIFAKNKDEIKSLEHSFFVMKKSLKKYRKEEEELRKYLENKVEEKVKQIKHQAYHDTLTGLPNRRLLTDRLKMAMEYARRKKEKLAVMFLDLDNFKKINDSVGHDIGDIFLQKISQRLLECCRKEDTVARFGGDEFIIILSDANTLDSIEAVAQKIIKKVSKSVKIEDNSIHSSASLGITIFPEHGENVSQLIKNADIAMYSAKDKGKNNYVFFKQSMNDSIYKLISMENEMRKAFEKNEFLLHYQPIVEPLSGKIIACEALIRWQKNYYELIYPNEFLQIAEETNLMGKLTDFVLNQACSDAARWAESLNHKVPVSVNISPNQFAQDDFIDKINDVVSNHNLDPTLLHIEITEDTLMENIQENLDKMNALKDIGIKLSIDDFGTGYSSLSYLKQFPIDTLKIDKSFVQELPNDKDIAIIKSIISLAHNMNLKIIAEGAENKEQVSILMGMNCNYLQGYYYSKPVTVYDFEMILEIQDLNYAIKQ